MAKSGEASQNIYIIHPRKGIQGNTFNGSHVRKTQIPLTNPAVSFNTKKHIFILQFFSVTFSANFYKYNGLAWDAALRYHANCAVLVHHAHSFRMFELQSIWRAVVSRSVVSTHLKLALFSLHLLFSLYLLNKFPFCQICFTALTKH